MWGGGHPCLGGNRAFMAEASDRPAINDGLGGRKKGGCRYKKMKKKGGEKTYLIIPTRSKLFKPAGRSRHNEMKFVKSVHYNSCVVTIAPRKNKLFCRSQKNGCLLAKNIHLLFKLEVASQKGSSLAKPDEVKMVSYIAEECGMPCFHWLFTKRQMSISPAY